jgi:hypothetical protein
MQVVPFPAFLGASYRSTSVNVATSELINWLVEPTQSETDKSPFPVALYGRPGISQFVNLGSPGSSVRALFAQDAFTICVVGSVVAELHNNGDGTGTATFLGGVVADDQPASIAFNGHGGHQFLIISGGFGYIYDTISNMFTQITDPSFPTNAVMCDFLDGYFIVMQASTSKFYLSSLEDGTTWDATDVGSVSSSSDALMAIRVVNRTLWMLGSQRTEPWVNAGGTFPFQPYANTLFEFGLGAQWSVAECDGAMIFVCSNEQGGAFVVQATLGGFNKISTFAEDRILSDLPDLSNVRAYSYQERGHTHYVLCPNTGPCLDYDLATRLWSTWGVWNDGNATYGPLHQWCHGYAWDSLHLVGDRTTGTIYVQSAEIGTDDGVPIRRVRTAPHLNQNHQPMFGSEVAIGLETGLATVADPDPVMSLSYSKDGGHTFSTPLDKSLGPMGKFAYLPRWNRTPGKFQDLVLRAVTTATIPVRINSCFLRLESGTGQR